MITFFWRGVVFDSNTSHYTCNVACQRAWCLSVSDNSSWPLSKIINLHCNYRVIDSSNKTKAFIGAKELKVPPAGARVGLPNVGDLIGRNTEPRCCLSNCWPVFQYLLNKTQSLCAEIFAKFHAWTHFYLSKIWWSKYTPTLYQVSAINWQTQSEQGRLYLHQSEINRREYEYCSCLFCVHDVTQNKSPETKW